MTTEQLDRWQEIVDGWRQQAEQLRSTKGPLYAVNLVMGNELMALADRQQKEINHARK